MLESGDMFFIAFPDVIMSTYRLFYYSPRSYNCGGPVAGQNLLQSSLDTSSNIGRDKSFVYDLTKELGIVRVRVAFVPRSAEIQPTFWRFVNLLFIYSFSLINLYFDISFLYF